jgi:hypothetical protein
MMARADSLQTCFSERHIGGLSLRSRLINAATFKGKTPAGVKSNGERR